MRENKKTKICKFQKTFLLCSSLFCFDQPFFFPRHMPEMNNPEPHLQESDAIGDDNVSHVNQDPQAQGICDSEEEYDRYKDNPDLLGEKKTAAGRLYAFDW